MKLKLTDLTTPDELAAFLNIRYERDLIYYIYRVPEEKRYLKFDIPKRAGGIRNISAPIIPLKFIQRRLAEALKEIYTPQNPVHGFVERRSIITNADRHLARRYVLNIDLVNFFGTINFGRVRGMFMAHPYKIPEKLSTVLAQICCHNNVLPQGAPTSPIVSNMLCSKMDTDLRRLAKKYSCRYTRYADDITFSTNKSEFPREIAYVEFEGENVRDVVIGNELQLIIQKNGFEINKNKSRLQGRSDRQEVTGLVTNKKRNVNRRFIRTTRSMIYSWINEGLSAATEKHYKKNLSHSVSDFKTPPDIEKIVRGRLEFIKSVRGLGFSPYITLANKYNELIEPSTKKLLVPGDNFLEFLNQNVFVIQNSQDIIGGMRMGTAFYLKDVEGFVTCNHLLIRDPNPFIKDDRDEFWLKHPKAPSKSYPLTLRTGKSDPLDLAIFDLKDAASFYEDHPNHKPLKLKNPFIDPKTHDKIFLVGWPKFSPGDTLAVKQGHIYSIGIKSSINIMYISEDIIEGNSGGPILDSHANVVGVAARGNNPDNAREVAEHVAISAKHIRDISS